MFSTKTSTFRSLSFILSAALIIQLLLLVPSVSAQESDRIAPVPATSPQAPLPPLCPISGFVTGEVLVEDVVRVNEEFVGNFAISNPTEYHLAGVRAAIALYANTDDIAPSYWAVLPGDYQLSPGVSTEIEFSLDTSGLAANSYVMRPIVAQGGVQELLGASVRNSELPSETTLIKEGNRSSEYSVAVAVNGEAAGLQTLDLTGARSLTATVVTTNETDRPLLNSEMVVAVAQGDVPLGAAVREATNDGVKLVPGGSRTTTVVDSNLQGGLYTVHAALSSEDVFQPVERAVLRIGEDVPDSSWPYISRVGMTDFPLQADTEVVACVNYVGANAESGLISEPLGVGFEILDENDEPLASMSVDNLTTSVSDWFAFTPGLNVSSFTVQTELLAERYLSIVPLVGDEEITLEQRNQVTLDPVQSIGGEYSCADVELCDATAQAVTLNLPSEGGQSGTNSFWFYAAIVIAAALLMYIMLRRMHPEKPNEIIDEQNELQ